MGRLKAAPTSSLNRQSFPGDVEEDDVDDDESADFAVLSVDVVSFLAAGASFLSPDPFLSPSCPFRA